MKRKLMTLSFLLGMFMLTACSDDDEMSTSVNDVPEKVQQEFVHRYPGVKDVKWENQFITHLGFLGYRDSDDEFDAHKNDGFGFQLQSDNLTVGLLYKF